jgi:hypothetical protein
MKTFTVKVPEVHYCYIVVEAEDEADAIKTAMSGEGDYGDDCQLEYGYTLDDANKYDVLEHERLEDK